MSRTYPAPGKAGDEAGQLRALTRELHEAAQDARAAARELAAARAEVNADVQAEVARIIESHINAKLTEFYTHLAEELRKVGAELDKCRDAAQHAADSVTAAAMDTEARLSGFTDATDAMTAIKEAIDSAVRDLAEQEGFIRNVAQLVQPGLKFKLA